MDLDSELSLEFQNAQPANNDTRMIRRWNEFSIEHTIIEGSETIHYQWEGRGYYLAVHDIILDDGETKIDGVQQVSPRDLRNTITFIPPGHRIEGWSSPARRQNSYTALFFDPSQLQEEVASLYRQRATSLKPVLYARDMPLLATMRKITAVLTDPRRRDITIYAESACILAAVDALALEQPTDAGKLSQRQFATIIDYVRENLHEKIGLAELAGAVGLTRYHFGRAFKATVGQSPYAFLQAQRARKAREMLEASDLSVEETASFCGFSNATALRRYFRQIGWDVPRSMRRNRH